MPRELHLNGLLKCMRWPHRLRCGYPAVSQAPLILLATAKEAVAPNSHRAPLISSFTMALCVWSGRLHSTRRFLEPVGSKKPVALEDGGGVLVFLPRAKCCSWSLRSSYFTVRCSLSPVSLVLLVELRWATIMRLLQLTGGNYSHCKCRSRLAAFH